ncbi:MAG: UvrD-helicase domain-containing protein [Candidatus Melainabacteria bacterium]
MSFTLTDEQLAIVNNDEKFIEVQAGPGTGKTFTLCRRIEKILDKRNLLPFEKILFCTYTNALTSNNLQALATQKNIDIRKVRTATLDSLLADVLCKLEISKEEKLALLSVDTEYKQARTMATKFLDEKPHEIACLVDLMIKRYPYIFIDEIQDIKNKEDSQISPKYRFLELLQASENLKQLIIVGDSKQSIFNQLPALRAFSLQNTPLTLTVSHRKEEHSGSAIEDIFSQVLNSEDTQKLTISEALNSIENGIHVEDCMIILQDLKNFPDKQRLFQLPGFWYGSFYDGQHALPQAFINSLFWYRDMQKGQVKQSLETVLLPFREVLSTGLTFSYFKCDYLNHFQKQSQTFGNFAKSLLELSFRQESSKVKKFQSFYANHQHLHDKPLNYFQNRLVITTIDSSKGLEADDVYFFENETSRSNQHKFVAHTRHRRKLFICSG